MGSRLPEVNQDHVTLTVDESFRKRKGTLAQRQLIQLLDLNDTEFCGCGDSFHWFSEDVIARV